MKTTEQVITETQYNHHGHTYEMGMMISTEDVQKLMTEYAKELIDHIVEYRNMYFRVNVGAGGVLANKDEIEVLKSGLK